jgi:SMP-30/Gluconolactonase/LRE-like region
MPGRELRRPECVLLEADGYIAVVDDWQPGSAATARVVATDLCGTNELRFSADGQWLFVAQTAADHITRFRVHPRGRLTDRQVYGPERLGGGPDGFAFDAHGNLWTTLIGQDRLVAITPEGDVRTIWEDGDRAVEAAAMAAPDDSGVGTALGAKPGDGLAPRMASITFGGPRRDGVGRGAQRDAPDAAAVPARPRGGDRCRRDRGTRRGPCRRSSRYWRALGGSSTVA